MDPTYPLFYVFHFYLFGVIAIVSAIAFVTRRSPVAAALWLVSVLFCLAALYVMLDAHFLGAIQVLVYAGAIMVVFLFVVMLLNLGHPSELADARGKWGRLGAGVFAVLLIAEIWVITKSPPTAALSIPAGTMQGEFERYGAIGSVAAPLFREHLLAFEVTSVLLLAAIVGAVAIGKRRDSHVG